MDRRAILVLQDGSVYEGRAFGAESTSCGEVVFGTGMTGYQEMLTDPSFAGQILVFTYPLIGNYGVVEADSQSNRVRLSGLVVSEHCIHPSHYSSTLTLHQAVLAEGVPGIAGLDTRALTRHLRSAGVMMGMITSEMDAREALRALHRFPAYDTTDFVRRVSTEDPYEWQSGECDGACLPRTADRVGKTDNVAAKAHIVIVDCGLKYSIPRVLSRLGCRITIVPCTTTAEEVLGFNPDGVLLTPGPGNPALLGYIADTVAKLIGRKPLMGICLGHHLIAMASGARTYKLMYGHRGANHPVRDCATGAIYITAQNHGYAVDADSVSNGFEVSHLNLTDGTVEGLRHREFPILSVQFHCESSPGPLDSLCLFGRFLEMVKS